MIFVLKIAAIIIIGLLFLRLILFYVKRTMKKRFSQQSIMIVRKLLSYTALFIILILILKQLNVKLAAILGAAGIAGIAIGFASLETLMKSSWKRFPSHRRKTWERWWSESNPVVFVLRISRRSKASAPMSHSRRLSVTNPAELSPRLGRGW